MNRTDQKPFRTAIIILAAVGLLLGSVGLTGLYRQIRFSKTAVAVEARIIRFETQSQDSTGYPVVHYEINGQSYTQTLNAASSSWGLNDTVTLQVQPENPLQVRIGSVETLLFSILIGIGFLLILIGLILPVILKKFLTPAEFEDDKYAQD